MTGSTPRRVLLVSTSLMTAGAQVQVLLLASALKERGHAVAVASLRDPEAYQEAFARIGVPVTSLGMRRGVPDPRAIARLAGLVRRWRPDIVHSHMVHANLLARVTRLVSPMPVQISTAHNLTEGARWRDLAYRLTDPLCTLTTNVCRACVERFVAVGAVPRRKIVYLPNGLNTQAFDRDERARAELRRALEVDDAFVWLAVGRLDTQKDYPNLLRAVAALPEPVGAVRVLVAGAGPELAALQALAAGLGLPPERVRFLGSRTDVPALMSAADGFVLSSAWEGLPMVLLEAAASRLPLVATDVGGNAEIVREDAGGLLVPAKDAAALAGALARVMALSPDERAAWGLASRRHVEEAFDIEAIVDRWEALYERLLAARRIPPVAREA